MVWSNAPIGLVPRFLRPTGPAPDAGAQRARTQRHEPSGSGPVDDAVDTTFEGIAAPERKGAHFCTKEEMRANHRRLFSLALPEVVSIRRKFSDALGLSEICEHAACRRAKSCAGVHGAICILDHPDIAQPALRAVREHLQRTHTDGPEDA